MLQCEGYLQNYEYLKDTLFLKSAQFAAPISPETETQSGKSRLNVAGWPGRPGGVSSGHPAYSTAPVPTVAATDKTPRRLPFDEYQHCFDKI